MSLIWIVNILSVFFLCVFFAGIVIPQIQGFYRTGNGADAACPLRGTDAWYCG
ncbi:hypothetical protein NXX74_09880 [Bacteroides fragilis]|nr:hypothetical protein [Bacteroides fragilis]